MSKPRAVKTRFVEPYNGDKTNIPGIKGAEAQQSGVYLIMSKQTRQIVYIGFSANQLYKTIYRHFQTWNDIRPRVTYSKHSYLVRVIFTTPARASNLEKYLIMKLQPRDNETKYEFYLELEQQDKAEEIYSEAPFLKADEENPF